MNYVKYMATRDKVEKIKPSHKNLLATNNQKKLIREIISDFSDAKNLFEYEDYLKNPTQQNASEFISTAMEHNLDIILTKKNYVDYIANRPGVEKLNENGMFTDDDEIVNLIKLAEEVGSHTGNVWTHIISLRREDATRLGFDCAKSWISICRSKRNELAQQMSIHPENLKWYAAFHNEGHHPHIHMIVYSTNPREGYVTKESICNMRSSFANDIFKQDLINIYKGQTIVRDNLKAIAKGTVAELIKNIGNNSLLSSELNDLFMGLKQTLDTCTGKKVYSFLPKVGKDIVNKIIDILEQDESIKQLLEVWYIKKDDIYNTYRDKVPEHHSLSSIPEFKSLKNTIIQLVSDMDTFLLPEETMPLQYEHEYDSEQNIKNTDDDYSPHENVNSNESNQYVMEWSDDYKEAKEFYYGTDNAEKDLIKAKELLELEMERGNILAFYDLAVMYERGIGVEKNEDESIKLFQKAYCGFLHINRNSTQEKILEYTNYRIGKMYLYGQGMEKNYEEAIRFLQEAPKSIYALYSLGSIFEKGLGTEINYNKAFDYYISSKSNPYSAYSVAELIKNRKVNTNINEVELFNSAYKGFEKFEKNSHDDNLQYRLGKMNYQGKGTEVNVEKAIDYLKNSTAMGNDNAKYLLAKIYLEMGMVGNVPQAIIWLEELADKNIIHACNLIAKEYRRGVNIDINIDKAIRYYSISADKNDCFAQYELYKIYFNTAGHTNIELSINYLLKSAENGFDIAQYQLGKYYLQDEPIKRVDIGIEWLQKSAQQGNQFAQYTIGKLFLFGKEVPQDKEKAVLYLTASAEQGNEYAIYLLNHMNDFQGQPVTLLTSRLLYHLQNVFTNRMLPDPFNPLKNVDKKLKLKIWQKRAALGHKMNDYSAMHTNN